MHLKPSENLKIRLATSRTYFNQIWSSYLPSFNFFTFPTSAQVRVISRWGNPSFLTNQEQVWKLTHQFSSQARNLYKSEFDEL